MSNIENNTLSRFAEVFKALSNPHRLHLFLRLISCCPPGTRCAWDSDAKRYVGELAEEVNVAPSTVSHHIKELRNAGLIKVARQGKNIECWIDPEAVRAVAELLAGRFPEGLLVDEPSRRRRDSRCDMVPTRDSIVEAPRGDGCPDGTETASSCCSSENDHRLSEARSACPIAAR